MSAIVSYRDLDNGNIAVKTACFLMGYETTLEITPEQWIRIEDWLQGKALIQEALPDLTADERELLISGIRPDDWDAMFPAD